MAPSSSARLPSTCATCRQARFLEVREEIVGGQLKWFEAFACDCGHGFETGGVGLPSPGARNAILAQSGRAEVWVDSASHVEATIVLLVRGLGQPEAQARARLSVVPAVAYEGTHVEASFIAQALARGGVQTRVVSFLPSPASS